MKMSEKLKYTLDDNSKVFRANKIDTEVSYGNIINNNLIILRDEEDKICGYEVLDSKKISNIKKRINDKE